MKILLRLIVVALVLLAVVAAASTDKNKFHCCSTIFSGVCPECFKCPFTKNPIERMDTMLKERIFGQDEALQTIITAFKAHDKTKPLTFHFAGDNGVGKSLTAKTIAEALFQYGNIDSGDFQGFLYLRGEQFQGLDQVEEYRQIITRRIVEQLVTCPNSLIVFDEVEYLAPQTVSAVSAFLDDSISTFQYGDKIKCRTNEATFIVISDFGTEGKTGNMTFQEVKTLVERDSREFWTNPKQPSVITHIVPFMALGTAARKQTAHYHLQRLAHLPVFSDSNIHSISIDNDVDSVISSLSDVAYPSQNGRGISKYIESYVLPQIVSSLDRYDNENGDHHQQQPPKGSKMKRVLHVTARKPLQVFHKAQFDLKVEEILVKENKTSFWGKFTGKSKSEL